MKLYLIVVNSQRLFCSQNLVLILGVSDKLSFLRVEENGCLVVVELGTNAGFQIISEIRDYITQVIITM